MQNAEKDLSKSLLTFYLLTFVEYISKIIVVKINFEA